MDKRLVLTEKQREILERYNAVVKEMHEAKILCVFQPFEEIGAINGEHVMDLGFAEDYSAANDEEFLYFNDLEKIECPFGLNLTCDEYSFYARFDND